MLRFVAFYLPQFYPFPENDAWWGKGFTEWTNVTKAQPLFDGHYQPHLPTDLGFYDLRLRETRLDQISLATEYGIDAFCFHYYWFGGKRLLDRPVDDFLADKDSSIQFCLCFANENWTRRWDAAEHQVLIAQNYYDGWERDFASSILPFIQDDRYLRIDGKPLLVIYRAQHLPDPNKSAAALREFFSEAIGIEIYLCSALIRGNWDYKQFGFDAGVEFPPHNVRARDVRDAIKTKEFFQGNMFSYPDVAAQYLNRNYADETVFRTVFPSWDNTSRVGDRALVTLDSTPANFEKWLAGATRLTLSERTGDEQLVFINAWNEWAEGCHLEPDRRHGRAYLAAVRNAKLSPDKATEGEFERPDTSGFAASVAIGVPPPRAELVLFLGRLLSRTPALFQLARWSYHQLRRLKRLLGGSHG